MKQLCINNLNNSIRVDILDPELFESCCLPCDVDQPLMRQVVSDLEYGVSGRATIPACFDDQEQIDNFEVDTVTDIRYSPWDRAADACRQRPVHIEIGKDTDPLPPSEPPIDPEN